MNMQVKPERVAQSTPLYMGVGKFADLPELCEAKGVFFAGNARILCSVGQSTTC